MNWAKTSLLVFCSALLGKQSSPRVSGVVIAFVTFFPVTTWAQSPRDYLNTPVNAASFFLDFLNTNSETAAESDLPLPNNVAVSRLGFATLLWSFPLANRYGGVGVTGGYAGVQVTGSLGKISKSGFSDPSITFHVNIFGAPALHKDKYADAIPKTFSSFHLTANAPLGSYDRNSPVNPGANRWAFNPLVNLSITQDKGVSWFDLYAGHVSLRTMVHFRETISSRKTRWRYSRGFTVTTSANECLQESA